MGFNRVNCVQWKYMEGMIKEEGLKVKKKMETARWHTCVLYVTLQSVNYIIMIVNTVDKHALVSIINMW